MSKLRAEKIRKYSVTIIFVESATISLVLNNIPAFHSYGAARSIEIARKEEGKWATGGKQGKKGKKKAGKN